MPETSSKRRRSPSGKQARATLRPAQAKSSPDTPRSTPAIQTVAPGVPFISPEREYAFIREDLRRLLTTAVILIAVMIGLLLFIDR